MPVLVYAAPNAGSRSGVEVCNDGGLQGFQGRVIVSIGESYVAVDGDRDNPAPLNSFVRVGAAGTCVGNATRTDATQPCA